MYEAALSASEPINADPLVRAVDAHLANAGPSVRPRRDAVRTDFLRDGGQISATRLHNLRSELSDVISEATRAGRGKQARALGEVLRPMDAELDRLPGYAEARAGYARSKAVEDALQEGRKALSGGPAKVIRPGALKAQPDAMTPEARAAYRQGTREWIADKLGTARRRLGASC